MLTYKNVVSIISLLNEWEKTDIPRNRKVLKLLAVSAIGDLKKDFDSIYGYSLLEYAVDADPPGLALLFAAPKVREAFLEAFGGSAPGVCRVNTPGSGKYSRTCWDMNSRQRLYDFKPGKEKGFEKCLLQQLKEEKKLSGYLSRIQAGFGLETEIKRFKELYDFFTKQSGDAFALKRYNDDNQFKMSPG
ncbi:MAG: hypothetical protein GY757_55825 [bacterium]|nr:hypothetical protein [bacterium]